MRVLIVKLSSMGDVIHAIPTVHDIRREFPGASIDWVVEPAFAPILRFVENLDSVIEMPLRRWRGTWWRPGVGYEVRRFLDRLRHRSYDAVLDLQGLTKSAVVARLARGRSFGLADQTEGSSYEAPARWLVDRPLRIRRRVHALDRSRELAALALGYDVASTPQYGMLATTRRVDRTKTLVAVHGTSRPDKLWAEEAWIELGRRIVAHGWRFALPRAGDAERDRAIRIARAVGSGAEVWPEMAIGSLVERMGAAGGVIGVDSGLSHLAVALGLPHVQIYTTSTAWRTGPLPEHGCRCQMAIEPSADEVAVDRVWGAWRTVLAVEASRSTC